MKSFLQSTLSIVALVVVVSAVGLTIEWVRRRGLRNWAKEQGGAFEPGAFFAGVRPPEAAAFDGGGGDSITYHNVVRLERPGAAYVVAQCRTSYKDTKDNVKSSTCVVCFVSIPGGTFPSVSVYRPVHDFGFGRLLGMPEPPAPLRVGDPVAGFKERFQVLPLAGASETAPEALARFLPPAVQQELLSQESLIAGLQARGNVVRVQAVGQQTGYPHREVFEFSERLVALWSAPR